MKRKFTLGALLILILILLLVKFSKPTDYINLINNMSQKELVQIQEVQKRAYEYALSCSNTTNPELTFDEIRWVIWPGKMIEVNATDGSVNLAGYFRVSENTIYVAYPFRKTPWVYGHESLHAIGYIGHPTTPFRFPCKLLADQN